MPQRDRALWRSATAIVQALADLRETAFRPRLPLSPVADLIRLQRLVDAAQDRGWRTAARIMQHSLRTRVQWFINDLQRHVNDTAEPATDPPPSAGNVYQDLLALQTEFEDVTVDEQATTVTALTDRIILEDIDLGPFVLVWNWSRIDEDQELRVVPQEPHYARGDDEVCHPHVRGETLCVGEAEQPLRRAFRAGRIEDAFLIVRQVLRTYNPGSPHVALVDWSGCHCLSCDTTLTEGEAWHCDTCGDDLCDDCREACAVCGNTLCQRCAARCADCEATVCRGCRPVIGSRRLSLCTPCHEKEHTPDEDPPENDQEDPADVRSPHDPAAAILPDGVGETAVPAGGG